MRKKIERRVDHAILVITSVSLTLRVNMADAVYKHSRRGLFVAPPSGFNDASIIVVTK